MSKLLSGQQLFMSKDIHNQIVAEDTPAPPPPPPMLSEAACVVTTSNAGEHIVCDYLSLAYETPQNPWKSGKKLDLFSYEFTNVPRTFPLSCFQVGTAGGSNVFRPQMHQRFSTNAQLMGIHYARVCERWRCAPAGLNFPWYPDFNWPPPGGEEVFDNSNVTTMSGTSEKYGPMFVSLEVIWDTPLTKRHAIRGYSLPLGTSLFIVWGWSYTIPPGFGRIFRRRDGTYGIEYSVPW